MITKKSESLNSATKKIRNNFVNVNHDNFDEAPPSYESAVVSINGDKQNIVNSTTHQQPTVNVGETTVIITNQTRQEKPHLFDVGASKS